MALTTAQKTALGMVLLSLIGTFSFIGYKTFDNVKYKVFRDSNKYLELGIEEGTTTPAQPERNIAIQISFIRGKDM